YFQIDFRFQALKRNRKEELVATLALDSLAARLATIDQEKIGLSSEHCLRHIDDPNEPLRVLEIHERGATGMYGPWDQNKSHMYLALLSIGFTEKASGAGGSYGYGKA